MFQDRGILNHQVLNIGLETNEMFPILTMNCQYCVTVYQHIMTALYTRSDNMSNDRHHIRHHISSIHYCIDHSGELSQWKLEGKGLILSSISSPIMSTPDIQPQTGLCNCVPF